ncbi:unnamed protein product, partial [Adineta steineri]
SVTVLPMALEVSRLFGGFFLAPSRLPKYFAWLDVLSYADRDKNSCIENGEIIIRELGLDYINIIGCIGALLAFIIICRSIAFLGVRFLKN